MTDHATAAERFHNEYLRLRTPGRVPKLADVLALANYHATMAVVGAVRGLAPNAAQDAAGCPQIDQQPEPGQVDGGKAAEATDQDRWDRNYFAYLGHDGKPARTWNLTDLRQFIPISDPETPYSIPQRFVLGVDATTAQHDAEQRAVKAEAERDAILDDLRKHVHEADLAGGNVTPDMLTEVIDRHTPEG